MNADEVVIDEVQRHGVLMVLKLFRESVCKPGHAARVHPDIQVVSLRIGRAHVLRVGTAFDPVLDDPGAIRRAVAALGAFWRGSVQLDQHGVVHVGSEGVLDRAKVCLMAVRRELNAVLKPLGEIADESARIFAVAPANECKGRTKTRPRGGANPGHRDQPL